MQVSAETISHGDADVLAEIEDSRKRLADAAVTKAEMLICTALERKGSSKTAGRLRNFTAELTATLKKDWTRSLHADLVPLVQDVLGVRPVTPASAASATPP